ncbi:DUF4346 domain-containing protein [Patescibacteria group bacterium]|nr:DUF4346 domain-containing protein [Patescibacteria group bacterium]
MKDQFTILLIANNIYLQHDGFSTKGKTAKKIIQDLLNHKVVKRIDHALYLGRELARAEQCLKDGRDYVQG